MRGAARRGPLWGASSPLQSARWLPRSQQAVSLGGNDLPGTASARRTEGRSGREVPHLAPAVAEFLFRFVQEVKHATSFGIDRIVDDHSGQPLGRRCLGRLAPPRSRAIGRLLELPVAVAGKPAAGRVLGPRPVADASKTDALRAEASFAEYRRPAGVPGRSRPGTPVGFPTPFTPAGADRPGRVPTPETGYRPG